MKLKGKGNNAIWVSLLSGLNIFIQGLVQLSIAYFFGTGRELESYYVALTIPTYVIIVLAFCLNTSFVPQYLGAKNEKGEQAAREFAHVVLFWSTVIALFISVMGILLSKILVYALFGAVNKYYIATTISMERYLWFLVVINTINTLLISRWQADKKYFFPSILPIFAGIITIIILFAFSKLFGVWSLVIGTISGTTFQMLFLVFADSKWFVGAWRTDKGIFKSWYKKVFILGTGNIITRFSPVMERMAASTQIAGSIAELNYANRIASAFSAVTSSGIGITGFTQLSENSSKEKRIQFNDILIKMLKISTLIVFPLAIFIFMRSDWIVKLLFLRGKFSISSVSNVSYLLQCYVLFFVFANYGTIIGRALYALGLNFLGSFLDVLGVIYYGVLLFFFSKYYQTPGIALAYSIYFCVSTIIATFFLFRHVKISLKKSEFFFIFKIIVLSIVLIGYLSLMDFLGHRYSIIFNFASGPIFIIVAILLKLEEIILLLDRIKTSLGKRFYKRTNYESIVNE